VDPDQHARRLGDGVRFVTADGPNGDAIARFYGQHPYPPPIADLAAVARGWSDGTRRRIEHHRLWPSLAYRDDHSILVAGCGTSQAAKYAIRYPHARVVGIDVSEAGIRATRALAARHGLGNLETHRLAIEDVGALDRSFDHVVCTGVLHHLSDPAAGLAALRGVLAPTGAVHLMVYAAYGRTGVAMIQEFCRMLGVRPDPEEIDDLVATLRELPIGHPLGHLLRNTPDFADDDALADALLNPRERSYTVPQVLDLLDTAGLRFGRWVRQAPYRPLCGVLHDLPHGSRIAGLPLVDQFAAMELFRGSMVRHSVIAHRAAAPTSAVRFDGDSWRNQVPVRTASSVMVGENLPSGVAAALLNRAHTYPDLVLFVTEDERQIFDRIDGRHTMEDLGGDPAFFERLWWHDLTVVDASHGPTNGGPGPTL
jgi:SAM-dependent methyltransferase